VRSAAPVLDAVVMLVDNAVYVNGQRTADPQSLDETYEVLRERNGMAWIGLYRPDVAEIRSVATEFELHDLPGRTRSRRISGPSWSGTVRPCSWCCSRPGISMTWNGSNSANCMRSSGSIL